MITTGSFHVSSGEYTKMVFTRFFARDWTLYALLLAVFAALMNVNVNFIIVILALIFIVYPMTLSFVYFANCMVVEMRWSVLPKTMIVDESGIKLNFDGFSKQIDWREFSYCQAKGSCMLLGLKVRQFTFLIVPYTAFQSKDDLREFAICAKSKIKLKSGIRT